MNPTADRYWQATRHPWACTAFVVPLLLLYEAGLFLLGSGQGEGVRNGADVWLRDVLARLGLDPYLAAPAFLILILLAWTLSCRRPRPHDLLGTWSGMVFESAIFALLLYGLGEGIGPVVRFLQEGAFLTMGVPGATAEGTVPEPALEYILSYLGAGLYEETLFRLILFSGLLGLFLHLEMPAAAAGVGAGILSALAFSAAHHLGPHGEPFVWPVFFFRSLAGLYFAWLFRMRGFGIAVGAHAGYDVLVGLVVPP